MSSGLAASPRIPHARSIADRIISRWRLPLLVLGWVLIVISPIVGLIPAPGGIFVFAAGLALVLNNSAWAKRRYVRLKQRWPKLGRLADRAMRRPKRAAPLRDVD